MIVTNNLTGKVDFVDETKIKLPVTDFPTAKPTETELLTAEILSLKARLAKVESTDTVKAELVAISEPIVKEPIISK